MTNTPRFDKVQKKLKTSVGAQNVLYKFVEETQPLIDNIVTYRNRMEHPKEGLEFIIRNYTLLPNGIIDVPVWYINGNEPIPVADEMEQITNYLLEFGEIFFALCSLEKKQIPLPYRIIEIPEAKRDTKCPTRFSFEIDMDKYLSNNTRRNVSD